MVKILNKGQNNLKWFAAFFELFSLQSYADLSLLSGKDLPVVWDAKKCG